MSVDLGQLQPELRLVVEQLVARAHELLGRGVVVVQGFRSFDEQRALYRQGRVTPGPVVTNADSGESAHNFGAAMDVAFLGADGRPSWEDSLPWSQLGELGEQLGLVWGGRWRFPDLDHFELPGWQQFRVCGGYRR